MCFVSQISGLPVSGARSHLTVTTPSFLLTQVRVRSNNNAAQSSFCNPQNFSVLTRLPHDPAKLRRSLQYPINPPQIVVPQAYHIHGKHGSHIVY
jgi:hypothetical protein